MGERERIEIRPAQPGDAAGVADVWLRSFSAALPTVARAHSNDDVRRWVREVLLPDSAVWVAVDTSARTSAEVSADTSAEASADTSVDGSAHAAADAGADAILGMMALGGVDGDGCTELDQLYVVPERFSQGIGTRLVERARIEAPGGLVLWTFQVNTAARAFYASRGFIEVALTDGADNEEHEPDVRLRWQPTDPQQTTSQDITQRRKP
ncbi:GNAT family N-acetyltransferase [Glaciibacter flavus]|uniref:GNAT family N-acetyltransferase n=1 Tax=Orlajensenia flava TaxID=2565934 RepID=A0A4S4FVA0_9MICO|nr:GNAT family N-acetyltransferase [Glaciibacter flavus]THG34424.1 GNAT family N-acetyltransferase [Glaciibacter flavus]